MNLAWTWVRCRMVLHWLRSGKSVEGCGWGGDEVGFIGSGNGI